MEKMKCICTNLKIINKDGMPHVNINLYGFESHVIVFEFIFSLAIVDDKKERDKEIETLSRNKMRDIKCKIGSPGAIGNIKSMKKGIMEKMVKLNQNWNRSACQLGLN